MPAERESSQSQAGATGSPAAVDQPGAVALAGDGEIALRGGEVRHLLAELRAASRRRSVQVRAIPARRRRRRRGRRRSARAATAICSPAEVEGHRLDDGGAGIDADEKVAPDHAGSPACAEGRAGIGCRRGGGRRRRHAVESEAPDGARRRCDAAVTMTRLAADRRRRRGSGRRATELDDDLARRPPLPTRAACGRSPRWTSSRPAIGEGRRQSRRTSPSAGDDGRAFATSKERSIRAAHRRRSSAARR